MTLEADLKDLSIDTTQKTQGTDTFRPKDDAKDNKMEQKEASSSTSNLGLQTVSEPATREQQPAPAFENVPDGVAQCDKDEYLVKTIDWRDKKVRIITQNENGPCPLVAICNVLLLRGDLDIRPPDREIVTFEYLVDRLGDYLLNHAPTDEPVAVNGGCESMNMSVQISPFQTTKAQSPPENPEEQPQAPKRQDTSEFVLTYRHNLDAAFSILPNLKSGLDVNIKFDSIHGFEPTAELAMFDLFDVNLVHGWVADPQDVETFDVIVNKCGTYNYAVELIVQADELSIRRSDAGLTVAKSLSTAEEEKLHQGFVATEFLKDTATQLTYFGLDLLLDSIPTDTLCVLFRNNHFSTVYRHPSSGLYMLVTDSGLVSERSVVWESLADVDQGSSEFFNGSFSKPNIQERCGNSDTAVQEATTDLDYAIAVSIQDEQKRQHRQSMIGQQPSLVPPPLQAPPSQHQQAPVQKSTLNSSHKSSSNKKNNSCIIS
ncbi:protein FAM63B [Mucor ambiguus]|uniref:Protein FAM63B n=1 Tax=Mucor ambiguus TaxID=91626 RepID=A0A0C9MD42_9FUNG|nr:protein FAM63B [Mucor ambiguus]